ncbi:glycosyltransferase family 87 protein [Corynebacterium ureicelerivorans]|uniref:glycosyltransferase family 87 protein n=1 Tax=Corynebacterium ureicelerivorans TaxID=401472 RepID=UPI0026536F0F|nr:glycosyltransferase family 87 protein [Corynebacterium ureicelerivorans]MDN8604840.1 glycosyltransferase family 87 protein [Corynebacterium ureicelerivorans]
MIASPPTRRRPLRISTTTQQDLSAVPTVPLAPAVTAAAWPAAVMLVVHRLFVLAREGSVTDDFTTVWSAARRFVERVPVYNEIYSHVDPHYLYNPGATLLLSPLGLISDVATARPLFIAVNAACIIAALAWLTRLWERPLSGPTLPVAIALAFCTEAVTNTLVFSNINGVLLLALVAFIALLVFRRDIAAGVVLGLAVLVKPMFAPLVVLPLLQLRWRPVVGAVAVPVLMNLIAWPLTPGARDYTAVVLPYLRITRDYANSSLSGFAVYFGMPAWAHGLVFVLLAAAVGATVLGLARVRATQELLFLSVGSGVLLAGVCVLSSLGQAYYSMTLFPALFSVFHPDSPARTWPTWLGAVLCLSPLNWSTAVHPLSGSWLNTFLPTLGWAVFIVSCAAWVLSRTHKRDTSTTRTERTVR